MMTLHHVEELKDNIPIERAQRLHDQIFWTKDIKESNPNEAMALRQ